MAVENGIEALFAHPFIAAQIPLVGRRYFKGARVVHLRHHASAAVPVPEDRVLFVCRGVVEVYYKGRFERFATAGDVIGISRELVQLTSPISVRGSDALVYSMKRRRVERLEHNGAGEELYREMLTRDLASLLASRDVLMENLEDAFRDPGAGMIPGPYRAKDVNVVVCIMSASAPDMIRDALKQTDGWLRPIPGRNEMFILIFADYGVFNSLHPWGEGRRFHFRETGLLIPGMSEKDPMGFYVPEIYPDSYLAILVGREVYGFPKRRGRTLAGADFLEHRRILLETGGRIVLRATWGDRHEVGTAELGRQMLEAMVGIHLTDRLPQPSRMLLSPALEAGDLLQQAARHGFNLAFPEIPVYFRHRVPMAIPRDEEDMVQYRIDDLVRVPFTVEQGAAIQDCQVLHEPRVHMEPEFWLQGTCEAAFAVRVNFEMGDREIPHGPIQTAESILGLSDPNEIVVALMQETPLLGALGLVKKD